MKYATHMLSALVLASSLCAGCATSKPSPIAYLAVERPKGVIVTTQHDSVEKEFPRGGWYLANNNFRPAPDLASYVEQTAQQANTQILRNADVQLAVPFAFDILFFGYNHATDTVSALGK